MKADAQLQSDVVEALKRKPTVTASEVGVAVSSGAVRLGVVRTNAEKYAAEMAALRVPGVRAVSQEIRVKLAEEDGGSDGAIAEEVARAASIPGRRPRRCPGQRGGWLGDAPG